MKLYQMILFITNNFVLKINLEVTFFGGAGWNGNGNSSDIKLPDSVQTVTMRSL